MLWCGRMSVHLDVTVVVMAGGRGQRFDGMDKGLIEFAEQPLIEQVLTRLEPQTKHILISANRNLEQYRAYGYPVVSDALTGFQGPLAGISAALGELSTPYMVTAPCDGPFLPLDLVDRLRSNMRSDEPNVAVASCNGYLEPLYACIDKRLASSLTGFLAEGHRKVRHWIGSLPHTVVDFADQPDAFSNINSSKDLERIIAAK